MSRTHISTTNVPVLRPSEEFLAACEKLLAERGSEGPVICLGQAGPGRQFDDGGLRITALTSGHDAGALDIALTFVDSKGKTHTSPALQRLPGARLTHVHSHWVYGSQRIKQYRSNEEPSGPIDNSPYADISMAAA